jgi:hypothetical protein
VQKARTINKYPCHYGGESLPSNANALSPLGYRGAISRLSQRPATENKADAFPNELWQHLAFWPGHCVE